MGEFAQQHKPTAISPEALSALCAAKSHFIAHPFTKDKSGHGYKYVPLEDIQRAITPVLTDNQLLLVDELDGKHGSIDPTYGLKTTLYYVPTGEVVGQSFFLFNILPRYGEDKRGNPQLSVGTAQDIGSWRTYGARYNRATILDLVLVGEDDDAASLNRATGNGGGGKAKAKTTTTDDSLDW